MDRKHSAWDLKEEVNTAHAPRGLHVIHGKITLFTTQADFARENMEEWSLAQ